MPIKIGTKAILLPGVAKVMRGDKQVWSSALPEPVNYTITQKSVLEHDTANGTYNSIDKLTTSRVAFAYRNGSGYGMLKIADVNADNSITVIGSTTFNSAATDCIAIKALDSAHVAIVYRNAGQPSMKTLRLNGDNSITEIDSVTFGTPVSNVSTWSIDTVSSTKVIVAFSNSGSNYGAVALISFDSNNDNLSVLSVYNFDTAAGTFYSIKTISENKFIVAYTGGGSDGFIKTLSVDAENNFSTIATLEHDGQQCLSSSLDKISSTHFIMAYAGYGNEGKLKVITVDANANNITVIKFLNNYSSPGTHASLLLVDLNHFILAHGGPDNDVFIRTFALDASYNISQIDSKEHDTATANGTYNAICQLLSTKYVLVYAGSGEDGYIKVFELD